MAQTQRITGLATQVIHSHGILNVKYHDTTVVSATENDIMLNSGGWRTNTTKTRMNQASNEYNLGFTVFQKDYAWFVGYKGQTLPFADHMILAR